MRKLITVACLALLICTSAGLAEEIKVATYNVEHFQEHFSAFLTRKNDKEFAKDPANKDLMEQMKKQNDEDNWEVSEVMQKIDADIIGIQECCDQKNLEHFNKRWLREKYETVIVFPTNTDRDQHLGMMLKKDFKVIEKKDQYYLEKDAVGNERGDKLFARGPSFVLVEAPSGYRFWIGVTHQKSKARNSVPDTAWRNREAARTHEIMKELAKQGPPDVILLGDMNDELGMDEFEQKAGGDAIANLIGPAEDGFVLTTKSLIDQGKISFGGYWSKFHRSFIDQIIVTPSMKDQIVDVKVYDEGLSPVASDHYPVILNFKADAAPTTKPAAAK